MNLAFQKNAKVTRQRLVISSLLSFIAAYAFASLAIDRGSWLYYGLTLLSLGLGLQSLWRAKHFKSTK